LVKALYQWQLAGHSYDELMAQYSALAEFGRVDQDYFRELLKCVLEEVEAFDRVIATHAVRALDQLDAVGRAVLLIALAELKNRADVPTKVVINEAVELTKRYGATASFKFVNAILDKAAKELRGQGGRRAG
jgi:N utilization substance protein B